jgi:hypothetical protein
VERNMNDKINIAVLSFITRYKELSVELSPNNALSSLERVAIAVAAQPHSKLYVIVDEYDRFANQLMHDHLDVYKQVVQRNDALSSPLRAFLQTLKNLKCHNRTFVLGIIPLALADASAANNFKHLYSDNPVFADMLGFRRDDLDAVLRSLRFSDNGGKPRGLHGEQVEHVLGIMQRFYNGCHFRGGEATLFNPTSCVGFLDKLTEIATFRRTILNHQPKDDVRLVRFMSDVNVRGSLSVLQLVAAAAGGHDAVRKYNDLMASEGALNDAYLTVDSSALEPFRLGDIMRQLASPPMSSTADMPMALLYFNGLLTCRKQPTEAEAEAAGDNEQDATQHAGQPLRLSLPVTSQPAPAAAAAAPAEAAAAASVEPDTVQMVLPNEMTRLLYAKDVQKVVLASIADLRDVVENPRPDTIQRLLQGRFDTDASGPPATFDQHWRESTVQTTVITFLRTFLRTTNLHVGVAVSSEQQAGRGFFDVLLQTTDANPRALLLELGLVRVDQIEYPQTTGISQDVGWRFQFDKVHKFLRETDPRAISLKFDNKFNTNNKTVEDVLQHKLRQVKSNRDEVQRGFC